MICKQCKGRGVKLRVLKNAAGNTVATEWVGCFMCHGEGLVDGGEDTEVMDKLVEEMERDYKTAWEL